MSAAERLLLVSEETLRALVREEMRAALADRAPANDTAEWLDAQGAAELLRVHRRTVTRLIAREGLPAQRIGKLWRFQRTALLTWLRTRE